MSDSFSAEVSQRICQHMNDDHGDAVVLYAKAFGGVTQATSAEMLSIDADGMNLQAQANRGHLEKSNCIENKLALLRKSNS